MSFRVVGRARGNGIYRRRSEKLSLLLTVLQIIDTLPSVGMTCFARPASTLSRGNAMHWEVRYDMLYKVCFYAVPGIESVLEK